MNKAQWIGMYGRGAKVSIKDRNIHEGEVVSIYKDDSWDDDYIVGVKCNANSNYAEEVMPTKIDSVKLILRSMTQVTKMEEAKAWNLVGNKATEYLIDIGVDVFGKYKQGWVVYPKELKKEVIKKEQVNYEDFRNKNGKIYLKPSEDNFHFEPSSEKTEFILIENTEGVVKQLPPLKDIPFHKLEEIQEGLKK